jgi:hypothetical protein
MNFALSLNPRLTKKDRKKVEFSVKQFFGVTQFLNNGM